MTDLIERELDLEATPEEVWRAITEPAWLTLWLAEEISLELSPGGEASFVVDGESRTGWVEEISPPGEGIAGRLAFWWQADDAPASRVALELSRTASGTRVQVVEERPLEVLDLVGIPLSRPDGHGSPDHGPALVAG